MEIPITEARVGQQRPEAGSYSNAHIAVGPGSEGSAAAERIFADFCNDTIPVDPAWVARALGIEVIDAYLDPDVAGAIRRDAAGRTTIYLSTEDPPNRKRFTCAHEIGHFVKHGEERSDLDYVDYRAGTASMGVDDDERYANAFAASLLMPEKHVRRLRALGYNDQQLAQTFGVSKAAMVNRLKNLALYR